MIIQALQGLRGEDEQQQARAEVLLVQILHAAATDGRQWRAAAWLLERRFPERWAKPKSNRPRVSRR
jgi:hypothetical protein